MEGETSRKPCNSCSFHGSEVTTAKSRSIPGEIYTQDESSTLVSLDSILPGDLLEKVLSFLPIASILRSTSVCKRWHEAVRNGRCSWTTMPPQKPWYFMSTCSGEGRVSGHAFDPGLRKWYAFEFPGVERSNWSASSSGGLVCTMDGEHRSRISVCNPITRDRRRLRDAPGGELPDYRALAMAVDCRSQSYMVAVVKCKEAPQDYCRWEFSIHVYESETRTWATPLRELLAGWRGGDECVICKGSLYFLVYSTGGVRGNAEPRHRLAMYDLSRCSARGAASPLMQAAVPAPCALTCGRLMNLRERLVMVGGIGKADRPGIIKGIGIWELTSAGRGGEWREVARVPYRFFQGFGELDDVFASSGCGDLVYIQSFGSPALLTFDMSLRAWKWSAKAPVTKKFPLQLFTGFCFEPRLEISP